jgi:23S rRNA (adenine2030-N6)-methyltransferase
LNYRHVFHAGNFGDVFKHALLVPLVRGLQRKEKGLLFLDTHAGIGAYDLQSVPAGRTLEYVDGIGRLWNRTDLPAGVRDYVELVRAFNATRCALTRSPARSASPNPPAKAGEDRDQAVPLDAGSLSLRYYPGSPRLAAMLLRPQDRLALSELHPDDFETLRTEFARDRGVSIQRIDAYAALRAWLPPPERRALVLIDPPYEDANEVTRIHEGLAGSLTRFPAATYVIWYPIKDRAAAGAFKAMLGTLPLPPTCAVELMVFAADPSDRLNGCGMIVLNPPWPIAAELAALAAALRDSLALEPGATSRFEWLVDED